MPVGHTSRNVKHLIDKCLFNIWFWKLLDIPLYLTLRKVRNTYITLELIAILTLKANARKCKSRVSFQYSQSVECTQLLFLCVFNVEDVISVAWAEGWQEEWTRKFESEGSCSAGWMCFWFGEDPIRGVKVVGLKVASSSGFESRGGVGDIDPEPPEGILVQPFDCFEGWVGAMGASGAPLVSGWEPNARGDRTTTPALLVSNRADGADEAEKATVETSGAGAGRMSAPQMQMWRNKALPKRRVLWTSYSTRSHVNTFGKTCDARNHRKLLKLFHYQWIIKYKFTLKVSTRTKYLIHLEKQTI